MFVFRVGGYMVHRVDSLLDQEVDATMSVAMKWCNEHFGKPYTSSRPGRWDYHFGYARIFVFDEVDAFEFKIRWG
ncbi:MAG: hypothetical protein EOP84_08015 [Verrucomicrobiaceae bacterium]|nr:MAG: hypothetical protein EOP84_08015 [Verrucomicrobiaceae bacterium]